MNLNFLHCLESFEQDECQKRIQSYKILLQKYNSIHNLTQIKNINQNIQDSLEILNFVDFTQAKDIIDIGSGAGFPAVFLSFILNANFHLFEPNAKKAAFLRMVKIECALEHLYIHKEKIQECTNLKADIITSRAFMHTKAVIQLCKNITKQNSIIILWKGSQVYDEIQSLNNYELFERMFGKYCVIKDIHAKRE
ncbi:16S rRNA (guanine(527)-N(7))-methyltransferase RsmG [Campylobacter sp. MIT 21-1685]|uniref:16S rRNA (guanine(527)-N(7))-methyltransferase RsmG n=1 Tax=unclassified Campylobacter TaxID=2593542 RepID=UPI00224A4FB1|nr:MULTISPECIES: 16S rRNA (guanine(527)-N(7))-methyltransferase RsmG [unclassified Campylobacter]MCX2683118.1 16S rRNA (guanine(527)-N(7))-methyltransferase RsmG [Campylobacter sp. MIT 21-1684]MCX2751422.1 16S rRNA (guanine(527)-N(7))-methyltransferase RsmG [Campylobacter sp. MIT 21-1682]MCX2807622.1 16S rRNA (guanine(527)-N(7))-methyltransferase RsmG [Campylobacter sp. MIT 21-1685]